MTFKPENALEKSLMLAAGNPAHRPQFLKDFMESEIFSVQIGEIPNLDKEGHLKAGTSLKLLRLTSDNRELIPIFTSLRRLQVFTEGKWNFIRTQTRDFLELTKGAELVLNPGAEFGKEFTVSEIASLLDGSFWNPGKRRVVQKEQEVLLGQPARYPHELAKALVTLFKKMAEVKKAYLAHFHNPAENDPPHTLIALEISGDWDKVSRAIGLVINQVEVLDPPVDLIQITGGGGLEDYFINDCKPFYSK